MSRQKRYEGTVEMSCIAKTNQAPRTSENTHTKGEDEAKEGNEKQTPKTVSTKQRTKTRTAGTSCGAAQS